ncbi:MAG: endonuclease [Prevotella sp.]|nr:endonuclease [Prevotella sp.]
MKTKLLLSFVLSLVMGGVWAQGPNGSGTYYKNANGQSGQNLRTALAAIIGNPKAVSYDGLISAYELTDTRPDGTVRDWYSIDTKFHHGKDTGGYKKEGDSYNREHSVPQSWFNKKSPMKSDIVHVVPTDGYVNNRRSSFPFGKVLKATYESGLKAETKGYCKLGSSGSPGYSGTVFEVPDEIKGDMARIYFYMATCYKSQCASWGGNIFTSDGITTWELNQFLEWSRQDPVDAREIARNGAVYEVQKNRNPFVDYPGLEEYIWGTKKDNKFSYDQYEGSAVIDVPTVAMPTFSPDAGTYLNNVTVTISCATEGATIHYTTDGADASVNSPIYTQPIKLTSSSTIKAVAIKDDKSSYQTAAFYLITTEQPIDDPEPAIDGEIMLNADFFGTSYTGAINKSDNQDMEGTENGVAIVYSLASGENRYASSSQIRLYPNNELRFSVEQGTITGLEFVFVEGTPYKTLKVGSSSFDDGKWSGNAQQVTVTYGGSKKHARIAGVKVSVSGGTKIDGVQTKSLAGQRVIYDLSGRRVTNPSRGIYIVDGRVVVIQ